MLFLNLANLRSFDLVLISRIVCWTEGYTGNSHVDSHLLPHLLPPYHRRFTGGAKLFPADCLRTDPYLATNYSNDESDQVSLKHACNSFALDTSYTTCTAIDSSSLLAQKPPSLLITRVDGDNRQ